MLSLLTWWNHTSDRVLALAGQTLQDPHHNSLQPQRHWPSPIGHLPHELLLEIFYLCQDGDWPLTGYYARIPYYLRWTILAQICSNWRHIALTNPRLWSTVYLNHPVYAEQCSLKHANRVPLHLRLKPCDLRCQYQTFLNKLLARLDRVQSIEFWFTQSWCNSPTWERNFTLPPVTSALQSLTVHIPAEDHTMEFVHWVKECSFPTIRNLQLVGTVTNIPKCLLGPTLTKLILRANHGGGSQSIEFIMLVHSLSQMSHLEVLKLKDVQLLGNCTQAIMNTPIISLPNLRQLLLWTSHPSAELDYSNLFSLLKISFTVKCTLTFASSTTTQNVTSIFRALQRYLRSGDLRGLSLRNDFTSSHFGCSLAPLDVRTSFDNFMDQRLIVNLSCALSEPTWGSYSRRARFERNTNTGS
ncbi:hypothetical protein QCA50_003456 [Cerrena zonata]|uniref:F-box domain-containing protein n=1 Tax=Cerrena zonata TaxID=2478898 RepID=A0AAW0GJR3_9APHY